jgi:four helix bundle protein
MIGDSLRTENLADFGLRHTAREGSIARTTRVMSPGFWIAAKLHFMAHTLPVTLEDSHDPIRRMRVHQLAEELMPDAFEDAKRLGAEPVTSEIAPQLYAAVCGIEANIGEAYSRASGKERALRFEYALGEVRESMSWYKGGSPVLGDEITNDRRTRLEEMRRILLAIIPRERGKTMK